MFGSTVFFVLSVVTGVQSHQGLHLATEGLLQISPSFSGKGINLYPAHRPGHNRKDLQHVVPKIEQDLYYSQEGHRDAMHGSKHGSFKANFTHPTVVLDHTSHLKSIQCDDNANGTIKACFTPEAFKYAKKSWKAASLNLVTYHVGCGDEHSGARSYFHVNNIRFADDAHCVHMKTSMIKQEDAVHSGEITWGTYKHPKKRAAVKGHIKLTAQDTHTADDPSSDNHPADDSNSDAQPADDSNSDDQPEDDPNSDSEEPIEPTSTFSPDDDGDEPLGEKDDAGEEQDLTTNATALTDFFEGDDFDTSDFDKPMPQEDNPFLDFNDEKEEGNDQNPPTAEKQTRRRRRSPRKDLSVRHSDLTQRGISDFFEGIYKGIRKMLTTMSSYLVKAVKTVVTIAKTIGAIALTAAKVIAVPFGVPFDESYHSDFKFNHVIQGEASNRPPKIFDHADGFNLAGSGKIYTIQCAKCGIHGDFSVEGRLAFSVDGISKGEISLVNHDAFTIDAVFGITVEAQKADTIKEYSKQIAGLPLSPLAIPGIVTLGPEVTVSASVDVSIGGKAELLIGGSLSIGAGVAVLDLVDKSQNKLDGFETAFTPEAKFTGTISASIELGLPIALEVGLDVLNGRFKKTVGLANNPSIYASATLATGSEAKCNNGIELRVGVKNRIFVQALDLWDYDIRTDILYEKGIACVTYACRGLPYWEFSVANTHSRADGFDTNAVEDDVSVFKTVTDAIGSDSVAKPPEIKDISGSLTKHHGSVGFRIIMDKDKSSVLVAGKDGYLYLVDSNEKNDLSSPWGTVNTESTVVSLDVMGRMMTFIPDREGMVCDIRLHKAKGVPKKVHPW